MFACLPAGPIVASISNHPVLNLVEYASAMLVNCVFFRSGAILVHYRHSLCVCQAGNASPPAGPIGAGVSNLPGTREPARVQFETIGGREKAKLKEQKKPGGRLFDCGRICLG